MCLICKDWQSGRLTKREAFRALNEMLISPSDEEKKLHLFELSDRLMEDTINPDQKASGWPNAHDDEQ